MFVLMFAVDHLTVSQARNIVFDPAIPAGTVDEPAPAPATVDDEPDRTVVPPTDTVSYSSVDGSTNYNAAAGPVSIPTTSMLYSDS